MANRLTNPDIQFANTTGTPYAGGSLTFSASGTSTPLATYSNQALSIANTNPVVLDSAGRAGAIFLQNLAYKVILKDSLGNTIWTMDPVYTSDYSAIAQFAVNAGNPNGSVAGTAGAGSIPSSVIWDATNNILYVCTTTGTTTTAVWTAVNASSAANSVPSPQGYLTPTSATPIIPGDVVSATSIYYTPYVGNLVPIYSGSAFTSQTFAELTLTLAAQHSLNTIYDCFVFNNSGALTLVTGPAWSNSGAGAGARGSGGGSTQLARVSGFLTNAVSMTARNGATTYTVGANLGTYVGSLYIDGTAGQVTCHRSFGQSRKWGISNAFNRAVIDLQAGDATANWSYNTATIRASNGSSANSLTTFCGLQEELVNINQTQSIQLVTGGGPNVHATASTGIGLNSTTVYSGKNGNVGSRSDASENLSLSADSQAVYQLLPSLGINTINSLEKGTGIAGVTNTFIGSSASMILAATWRG